MPARYLPAYAPVAVYLAVIVTVLPFTRSTVTLASEDLGRPLILAAPNVAGNIYPSSAVSVTLAV